MREVLQLIRTQCIFVLLLGAGVWLLFGWRQALGGLAGGFVLVSASLLYARIALRRPALPVVIVRLHLLAELAKIVWSILFFLLLMLWQPGLGLWFIAGYAIPAMTYWLVLVIKPRQR